MGPSVEGVLTISANGSEPLNKMAAISIYDKNVPNLLLQEGLEADFCI